MVAEPEIAYLALKRFPRLGLLKLEYAAALALALEDVSEAGLGQQLQCATKARHDVEHLLHVVLEIQPYKRAQRVALAEQILDHRVRALVRGAQHHEARAVSRHQRVHHRATLMDAGAHHQPAHAVRQQPDRLLRLLHQLVKKAAEPFGQHVERLAPVVREALDAVAARQLLAQHAVAQ